ncbi:serine O-acetyltransferase [Aureococcus anophagefferens]|nr:serine O-acetyltransferase [Aureococcus anophagefferens]
MEDVDAPPLLSMKQAPGARVELPPFETAGPLLRLDEPELPVADADESEVPSAEAMVAQLKDLRAKLDDGIAFCANMATEKDNATRAVADARRELEQLRAAPPAGRDKAAAVAERGRRVPAVSDRARAATRLPPRQASAASASPVLAPYLARCIASRDSLADAVAGVLADRVAGGGAEGLPRDELAACLRALAASAPSLARDVAAVVDGDPAAPDALAVVLHFKGFLALAAHRAAHALWGSGDRDVALLLQGRASALFGVDIHPAASVGAGTFIDHATGVVVGEQASLGEGCYVLHGVTLGATGKVRDGRRHPAVGAGVTLGSGASVLGPITVGDGATVGANACVTKDVEAGATVVETGYLNNRVLAPRKKKAS